MDIGAGSGTWLHRHVSGGTHFRNRSEVSRGKRADLECARLLWSAGWTGRDLLTVDVVGLISVRLENGAPAITPFPFIRPGGRTPASGHGARLATALRRPRCCRP